MRKDYENGKYTIVFDESTGALYALRYGEYWKDLSGDKLIYQMLAEHLQVLEHNERLLSVCEELLESAEYWSEYDVPIGIVDKLRDAVAKAGGTNA